jgi:polysaccharide biosynthesis protein PslG
MKRSLWVCCLALPLLSRAAEIPPLVLPAGVGVNIHFVSGHGHDLDLIAAGGFKFVRMDFVWEAIERQQGQYDWSDYERLLSDLDERGLRAVFILDYSNPLYGQPVTSPDPLTQVPRRTTGSPRDPESIAAYARWAAASTAHFHGRRVLWEIWNEPNGNFWSPKPDATEYTTLALAACKAIRLADPQATIIGPASSGFPWEFLETFFQSGVLQYLDAVSVHPYRDNHHSPETAAADYLKLRQLIDTWAPPSRKGHIPVLSGEWGYPSHDKGVSLETQADFAVRQQLFNLLKEIPLSIWYDWKNDGTNPGYNEENFGTVGHDLTPKPAYLAIQTMVHELTGYRVVRRLKLPDQDDYVLLFAGPKASDYKLAAWTSAKPHSVSIDLGVLAPEVSPSRPASLVLDLKPSPQYRSTHASSSRSS